MEYFKLGKSMLIKLLVMIFIITGCLSSDVPTGNRSFQLPSSDCPFGQNCVTEGDPRIGGGTSLPPKVEIRHLIEPNLVSFSGYSNGTGQAGGGSYVRKLTLPKNFAGRIYLAGINVGSLSSKHVKVRFRFGLNKETVVIPATVTQAPGITPQTPISVLVMDLRSEPFRNIRLPFDLFDYNEYDLDQDGTLAQGVEPTNDNRNSGLYCRGLRVEDDPTFEGIGACGDQSGELCLYTYAKVLDQGLIKESGGILVPLSPSLPQIKSIPGSNYYQDFLTQQLLKPLPDSRPLPNSVLTSFKFAEDAVTLDSTRSDNSVKIVFGDNVGIWDSFTFPNGDKYFYRGPYRIVDFDNWQFAFPFGALHGKYRLFRENSFVHYNSFPLPDDDPSTPIQNRLYYNSYLFPLATKLNLNPGITHLASTDPDDVRFEDVLASGGKTLWMDGSNARAQSRNHDLEHIGSCNVSATIEIISKDNNNIDYVISQSRDVKLQLVRPTQYQTDSGNEVLFSNFKRCSSNNGCASSECCFNNRCWDQSLVSQCFDSSSAQGNRTIGQSCVSDLECSSLCCNRASGQCAPHNTLLSPPVLCNKPAGDYCISKEWCQKATVTKCYVIKTGTDPMGNTTCRQQCYYVEEQGDCMNGVCIPPVQSPIPPFDPDDPNACVGAIAPPNF